jgi:hypothetical protein
MVGQRRLLLLQAAADFFFLQNRRYPRSSALEWVGNRYQLSYMERQLLHRGVFGQAEALGRLAKRCKGADWQTACLVVDGHNVQITVESALLGRTLLRANDGAVRDLAGQSARFRFTGASEMALDMIFRFLQEHRPQRATFLFDAPMSHSGFLAARYRERLRAMGLAGEALAVPVPENEFPYARCVIASSDQAVQERASQWLDLASLVIDLTGSFEVAADFSSLALLRHGDQHLWSDGGLFG